MNDELKEFLINYGQDLSNDLLLFYQFFYNHKQVLGGDDDSTLKNYYEYGRVKDLLRAKDFFHFFNLCLGNYDFRRRLENEGINQNLLIKIRYIIFDFQEYKKHYNKDLESPDFSEVIKGQMPLGSYVKKYGFGEMLSIKEHYDKCGWMYNTIPYERTLNVSQSLLVELIKKNNFASDVFREKFEDIPNLENFLIQNMILGEYDSLQYLACSNTKYSYFNNKYNKTLVCSNKLLDACRTDIINHDLSYDIIVKFIDLLNMSIDLHNLNFDSGHQWVYNLVGSKKIKQYNIELAISVRDLFVEKISQSKLIRLF